MWLPRARFLAFCLCAMSCLIPFSAIQGANAQQAALPTAKPDSASSQPTASAGDLDESEDFQSLSLHGRSLKAQQPLVAEKGEFPGFTREILEVKWRRGDPIHLYVILPEGAKKPPVVLYLYSYPSETDRFRDDDFCRRVTQGGFAAVGFVSALTGQRYHDIPMKQWFVSELPYSLTASVHDVQMILNYLDSRGDVDMDRVGMFGQGSGGSIAVLAAAVDPRIKAIDLLNPWGDWPDWMAKSARVPDTERPNYVKPEFLDRVAPLDPVRWLPKLKSRPVRILDAMDDPITPAVSKRQIESAAPAPSGQVTEYGDTEAMQQELSGGKLFHWIKQQLRPDAGQQMVEQRP